MEDSEQMGYIHMDRFLPVMSRSGLTLQFAKLSPLSSLHQDNSAAEVPPCGPRGPAGGVQDSGHRELRPHHQGRHHAAVHWGGRGLQSGGDDGVLQCCAGPNHKVRPLQRVRSLPGGWRQFLMFDVSAVIGNTIQRSRLDIIDYLSRSNGKGRRRHLIRGDIKS